MSPWSLLNGRFPVTQVTQNHSTLGLYPHLFAPRFSAFLGFFSYGDRVLRHLRHCRGASIPPMVGDDFGRSVVGVGLCASRVVGRAAMSTSVPGSDRNSCRSAHNHAYLRHDANRPEPSTPLLRPRCLAAMLGMPDRLQGAEVGREDDAAVLRAIVPVSGGVPAKEDAAPDRATASASSPDRGAGRSAEPRGTTRTGRATGRTGAMTDGLELGTGGLRRDVGVGQTQGDAPLAAGGLRPGRTGVGTREAPTLVHPAEGRTPRYQRVTRRRNDQATAPQSPTWATGAKRRRHIRRTRRSATASAYR